MKAILFLAILLSTSSFVFSQKDTRQHELGLVFRQINNYGFTYKLGQQRAMWRFNSLFVSGSKEISNSFEDPNNPESKEVSTNLGFQFSVGREYRKSIAENFELRYGLDAFFGYGFRSSSQPNLTLSTLSFRMGGNFVFGMNYVINDKLVIGAELLPSFTYTTGTRTSSDTGTMKEVSTLSFGSSEKSVLLSLSYRF